MPNQVSQLPHVTNVSNRMSMWVAKLPPHAFPAFVLIQHGLCLTISGWWMVSKLHCLGSTLKSQNRQVVSAKNVTFIK